MRAAPIGIYPTTEKVIEAATIQAAITHNTPDGINAAVAAALMSHYFIYRLGAKRKLGEFLEAYRKIGFKTPPFTVSALINFGILQNM